MTTVVYTRKTEMVTEYDRHTVEVREMEVGFNYEVWVDEILIVTQVSPLTAAEVADGIETFIFDLGFSFVESANG